MPIDLDLFDRIQALGERFDGVDISFRRRVPHEWSGCWRVRLIASKNEREEYRQTGYGSTFNEATTDLLSKVGGR